MSNCEPNKLQFVQGREFYNKLMQEWLGSNILMCSTDNEGKQEIPEKFIKTLKAKIYRKMTDNDSKSYLPYLNKLVDLAITLIIILLIQNASLLITLLSLKN